METMLQSKGDFSSTKKLQNYQVLGQSHLMNSVGYRGSKLICRINTPKLQVWQRKEGITVTYGRGLITNG